MRQTATSPMLAHSHGVCQTVRQSTRQSTGQFPAIGSRIGGALSRFYRSIVAAQSARGQRLARPYLARQDDPTLMALGFSALEIAAIRRAPGGVGLPL